MTEWLLNVLCFMLCVGSHYCYITLSSQRWWKNKKDVTVKCNTAARQTRQIKTFQLDLIYLNPALHFFMSGEHQSSQTLNWMYLVTGYFPTASQQNIVCCDKCHRQFCSSSCNYSTKRLTHSLHWWNFIASSNFRCIYYSFIIYITQYPVNKWKIIIKKKSSSF